VTPLLPSVENVWNSRGFVPPAPPPLFPANPSCAKPPLFPPALPRPPLSSVETPRRPKALLHRDFRTAAPRSPHGDVPHTEMMIF
jgi:hypothetical protein